MKRDIKHEIINSNLPTNHKRSLCSFIDLIPRINDGTLKYIILFGSCARGTMNCGSDLDILIVTTKKKEILERADIRELVEEDVDIKVPVDLVFYTEEQFNTGTTYLTRTIKKEGILLWGEI